MKTSKLVFFSLLAFVMTVHVGCRKDSMIDIVNEVPQNTAVIKVVDLNGIVFDDQDQPLAGVNVEVGNRTTETDENGVFLVRQADVSSSGAAVKFTRDGYFELSRIVYPKSSKEKIFIKLNMTPYSAASKFEAALGGTINLNDGASVVFSPNSIVNADGSSYGGEVSVFSHWFDPTSRELALNSPASLEGIDKDGADKILGTYGMMGVELVSTAGQSLQIADGQQAELSFPIPASILADSPNDIPLWSLNEDTGKWIEEFVATKEGDTYVGKVSHFSFWNCDFPLDLVTISGVIQSESGVPLVNQGILIRLDAFNAAYGYTDNTGFFTGKVPKDAELTMTIADCNVDVVETQIGPFDVDTDLGIVNVVILSGISTITANLIGCVGESLGSAYGLVNGYQLVSAASDGSVNALITSCTNVTNQIKFYDGQELNVSDFIDLDFTLPENTLGDVTICEQLGEYINFSVAGGDYKLVEEPEAFVINGERVVIRGYGGIYGANFELSDAAALGTYEPNSAGVYLPPDINYSDGNYISCWNGDLNGFNCSQFTVTITELDLTGELIGGTFEGYLINGPNVNGTDPEEQFVTGSFRSKIVDQFDEATVSGRVWIDTNGNGTRDLDEEDATICGILFTRHGTPSSGNFGTSRVESVDGTYVFEGLQPGEYYLRMLNTNYDLTDFQSGDPAKDNDFYEPGGGTQNYYSYSFTIGSGEVLENVDLGFTTPNSIEGYIVSSGCEPEIDFNFILSGGLKPFTAELSDGQVDTFDDDINFTVLTGGNYTITVTDAVGNSTMVSKEINSYASVITGRIWEDTEGEIDGLYESTIDKKLEGVEVRLFTSDDVLVQTGFSDNAGYYFTNVAYGDYYIEVVTPTDYEITVQNLVDYEGSVVDPSTGKSDILTIENCGDLQRANCGFKAN